MAVDDDLVRWDLNFAWPEDSLNWTAPFPKTWPAAMGQRTYEGAIYHPFTAKVTWDTWENMPNPVQFYHRNTYIADARFNKQVPKGIYYKWGPLQTDEDILQLVRKRVAANAAGGKQAEQVLYSGLTYSIAGVFFYPIDRWLCAPCKAPQEGWREQAMKLNTLTSILTRFPSFISYPLLPIACLGFLFACGENADKRRTIATLSDMGHPGLTISSAALTL